MAGYLTCHALPAETLKTSGKAAAGAHGRQPTGLLEQVTWLAPWAGSWMVRAAAGAQMPQPRVLRERPWSMALMPQ